MFGFFPREPLKSNRRRRLATEEEFAEQKARGEPVWRFFGRRCYSYPDFSAGEEKGTSSWTASYLGLYGFLALFAAAFSFSWVEALVITAAAFIEAEVTGLLPYHTDHNRQGISGVNGWLAGHNLAQLFFKERRNWFCAGGLSVLGSYTLAWMKDEPVGHECHFQTMGAGVLAAVVMRHQLKARPVKSLAKWSGTITAVIMVAGLLLKYWLKKQYPLPQIKQEEI